MQITVSSYTSIGSRVENEDSGACERLGPEKMYAVVCDGLGRHGGGQEASQIAVSALKRARFPEMPTPAQIREWMELSNQEILRRRNSPQHMKTTAVALFVYGSRATWVHIGDSRLYHYYNGRLADFTADHSVSYLAVKLGEITRRDIPSHPDRNRVLRALGDDTIEPEIHGPVDLEPGEHAFLLCSDGLWERLHEDEIMLDLHKAQTPDAWLYSLRCRAEIRKHTDVDNNTAIAAFISV